MARGITTCQQAPHPPSTNNSRSNLASHDLDTEGTGAKPTASKTDVLRLEQERIPFADALATLRRLPQSRVTA